MLNKMRIFDRARVFDYCLFRDETFDLRGALISRPRVTEYISDVGYGSLFLRCQFHGEREREKERETVYGKFRRNAIAWRREYITPDVYGSRPPYGTTTMRIADFFSHKLRRGVKRYCIAV